MFFRISVTFSNWQSRISPVAIARLEKHGVATSNIQGDSDNSTKLIVATPDETYVYIGKFDHQTSPEQALIDLLHDDTVEMCAPVRVTALEFQRTQAD